MCKSFISTITAVTCSGIAAISTFSRQILFPRAQETKLKQTLSTTSTVFIIFITKLTCEELKKMNLNLRWVHSTHQNIHMSCQPFQHFLLIMTQKQRLDGQESDLERGQKPFSQKNKETREFTSKHSNLVKSAQRLQSGLLAPTSSALITSLRISTTDSCFVKYTRTYFLSLEQKQGVLRQR